MEERNYRNSIKHLKKLPLYWLWMPIIYCLVLASGLISLETCLPDDLGVAGLGLILILFYALVLAPIMSFFYCKKLREMSWTKYLCCIYNAVMIGMYFAVFLIVTRNYYNIGLISIINLLVEVTYEFSFLIVFIPALICGLITLIVYDVKKRKTEDNSLSQ